MSKIHNISLIKFDSGFLILEVDGKTLKIRLSDLSSKLASASDSDRNNFIVTDSGYGIHWPSLDEDISINGIIGKTK
jgi:hypothetical protein